MSHLNRNEVENLTMRAHRALARTRHEARYGAIKDFHFSFDAVEIVFPNKTAFDDFVRLAPNQPPPPNGSRFSVTETGPRRWRLVQAAGRRGGQILVPQDFELGNCFLSRSPGNDSFLDIVHAQYVVIGVSFIQDLILESSSYKPSIVAVKAEVPGMAGMATACEFLKKRGFTHYATVTSNGTVGAYFADVERDSLFLRVACQSIELEKEVNGA